MSDSRKQFSASGHIRRRLQGDPDPEPEVVDERRIDHFSTESIENRIAAALRKKEKPICQRPTDRPVNQLRESNNDADFLKQ